MQKDLKEILQEKTLEEILELLIFVLEHENLEEGKIILLS